ncbi:hypothetical protein SUDANB106_05097 [Streptomyces sp. enrichment culture]|uniref:hypothetical protein n=1 Tax=Streptomyces sp. enrichment culture TaxID=1795815 RepID=UPI003F54E2A0
MAERHSQDILSDLLPVAFAVGRFLYGRRPWPGSPTGQLPIEIGAFWVGWLPLLALPGPHAATAAVVLPGAFLTIVVTCAYVATGALTPAGRTSEAYAWLILSIGAGQAAGTALAGRLADHALAGAALPGIGAAFALTILLLARPGAGSPARTQQSPLPTPSRPRI